jgi:inosine triphosphate pyrophosphatase
MERILAEHEATQRKNGVEIKQQKEKTTMDHDDESDDDDSNKFKSLVELRVLNVDLPEIQEVDTIAIAKDKVILASQLAGGPCVVEDTSLKFTALGGMPGPYIKWFQDVLKCDGLYNILQAYDDKSATACCTLAFCPAPHADPVLFTGECHGTIVAPVEGRGFGWDSIFVPDSSIDGRPFSKMTVEEKNACSHRGKAVRKWATWLGKNHKALLERQQGSSTSLSLPGHKGLDFKVDFPEQ